MKNRIEYTKFKQAMTAAIEQRTEMLTEGYVSDDEDFIKLSVPDFPSPPTSITALYGYFLSKSDTQSAWEAAVEKAVYELTTMPIGFNLVAAMSGACSADDILPMTYPEIINPSKYEDVMDCLVHRDILDVTLCYKMALVTNGDGVPLVTAFITTDVTDTFDIMEEDLYDAAAENLEKMRFNGAKLQDGEMLVSQEGVMGAAPIAYFPGGLDSLLDLMKITEAYMIPVSTKTFIVKKTDPKAEAYDTLRSDLRKSNKSLYSNLVLSNEIYKYEKESGLRILR